VEVAMMTKVLKVWHSWFPRDAEAEDTRNAAAPEVGERKTPSTLVVRTAMRQKQKLAKASP